MKTFPYFFVLLFLSSTLFSQAIKGTYAIKNVQTGMLLRIKDANKSDGTPLVAYGPVNWKCVTWDFKQVEGQTYQLQNLFTGKTFQPVSPTPANGTVLEQQPLVSNQNNQQYGFIKTANNTYLINLKGTELYITPADPKGKENTGIILATKNNTRLQEWTIYEQQPTM